MSDIRNGLSIDKTQQPRAQLIANAAAAPNNPERQYKANGEFKPDTLTKDASAGQYEFWKRQFRRYYTTSNMDLAPVGDQRGHLEKCIDAQLGTVLTSDKDINCCVSLETDSVLVSSCTYMHALRFLSLYLTFNKAVLIK